MADEKDLTGGTTSDLSRRNFVALCCVGWSVMTGLCGMAGSFVQLALISRDLRI